MLPLEQFLANFEQGLARIRHRIAAGAHPSRKFDRDKDTVPNRDEIWIGVGESLPISSPSLVNGICLNNKPAGHLSVTDFVLNAPAESLTAWKQILENVSGIDQFFEQFTLVIEDASPDSCFGLLAFLVRVFGDKNAELPREWVDYIRGWEMGDVQLSAGPHSAYGCLHNSLVHQTIDVNPGRAWLDGLTLLSQVLALELKPTAILPEIQTHAITAARAQLAFEEQLYEDSLRQFQPIQITLPMTGSANRRRLVDVYFGEEGALPLGSIKAFARSDRTRPFLKNGYSVMALYRPFEEGSGNDMTISVDTSSGVDLRELWFRLEQLEDERWMGSRPSDHPRRGITGYPDGKRTDGTNSPNEPWYDAGNYTLLAAPRRLRSAEPGKTGQLGSKLSWVDVKEQLWATYQPFRDVRVRSGAAATASDRLALEAELQTLDQCAQEPFPDSLDAALSVTEPRLVVAGWHQRNNAELTFRVTPTLCRFLAACLKRPPTITSAVKLADLPGKNSYSLVKFSNGVAIVCDEGAFIVDAGRPSKLPIQALKTEFERARRILHQIESGTDRIAKLIRDTKGYIDGDRHELSELELLHNLASEQLGIAMELHEARIAKAVPEAKKFRDVLLTKWGVDGRLEALAQDVGLIKDLLQSHTELLAGRRFAFLQTYGLPLVVSSALCGFVFTDIGEHLDWPLDLGKIHWPGLLLFACLSGAGAMAIRLYSWLDERIRFRRRRSAIRNR